MHSAIVVVKMPKETPSGHDRWLAFCAAISALQVNDAVVRLGENTWQLDFQQDPGALALLIGACDIREAALLTYPLPSRAPGPPSFASMKMTPAFSRVRCIASTVLGLSESPRSKCSTV
jgi:hypothetical protein